jgi:hypothetical protein
VPDLRSMYKVTALMAKVALRADGNEHPGDADALRALLRHFATAFHGLDAGVIEDARHDEQAAIRLAHAVLAWWLATLPTAESSP